MTAKCRIDSTIFNRIFELDRATRGANEDVGIPLPWCIAAGFSPV